MKLEELTTVENLNTIMDYWVKSYEMKNGKGKIVSHEYFVDTNKNKVAIILTVDKEAK